MSNVDGHSVGRVSSARLRPVLPTLLTLLGLLLVASPSAFAALSGVAGTITYDKVTADPQKGLLLTSPVPTPAAGITIELVAATSAGASAGKVLGRTFTDDSGAYQILINLTAATNAYIRIRARSELAVVLNADTGFEVALVTGVFSLAPGATVGFSTKLTDSSRFNGPFNLLDIIRQANLLLRSVQPGFKPPVVTIIWATDYSGGSGSSVSTGAIFINGDRSVNSDEFDPFVLAHEYGHFIANNYSRPTEVHGTHILGDSLDARLAWSEGWANGFAALVLNSPDLIDTFGANGAKVSILTLKQDTAPWTTPGFTSEQSVGAVLWHIFASSPDGGTSLGLGFKPIFTTASGSLKNDFFVSLIEFADEFVRDNRGTASVGDGVAKVLGDHGITYTPGSNPSVTSPWKQPIASGTPVTGSLDSTTPSTRSNRFNLASASAFYTFTTTAAGNVSIQLVTTSSSKLATADLDLYVWDAKGNPVASSATFGGAGNGEQITASFPAGTYLIEVRSWYIDDLGSVFYNTGNYQLTATYPS